MKWEHVVAALGVLGGIASWLWHRWQARKAQDEAQDLREQAARLGMKDQGRKADEFADKAVDEITRGEHDDPAGDVVRLWGDGSEDSSPEGETGPT